MSYPYVRRTYSLVTSSSGYVTGDVIGGLTQVQNISPMGFIQGVNITSKSSLTSQVDFCTYRSSMPNSTITDNTAISVSTLDSTSMGPVIHVADWTSQGTPYLGTANGLAYEYGVSDGSSGFYFALVVRGTTTLASTNDIQVTITLVS